MQQPAPPADQSSALCRAIVGVVREYTGRGPTKVRATIASDVICVVMHDNHTKGEHALITIGEHALVSQLRRAYHRAMQPHLLEAAQTATGQTVRAVLADHDPHADVSTITFVLEPSAVTRAPILRPSAMAKVNGSTVSELAL